MRLTDRIALVTGGAHRVGRAIALSLAERGCHLIIHYHASGQAAAETVAEIQVMRRRAAAVQADLSTSEGVAKLFRLVDEVFGGLDLLVNSAAVLLPKDLLEVGDEDWRQTVGLNLKGAFFCLQQAALRMRARGGGAIVNISDLAGLRPWKRFPLHSISKAGVEMLTQVAALALAPNIRVNAIAPGAVLKPAGMDDSRWQKITSALPLRRPGTPQDVARAVVFLFENDYVTGETLVVDGGGQWA
ncbi:MAG: SDR family oxidoreductase [Chloroflexota bacterium]